MNLSPSLEQSVAIELAALKRAVMQAYIDLDYQALDDLYDDEFCVVDSEGERRSKQSELADLGQGPARLIDASYEPVVTRLFGDVAVVSGRSKLRFRRPTGDEEHEYVSVNVFVRRRGTWKYAAAFTP